MKILFILELLSQTLCLTKTIVLELSPSFWPIRLQDSLKWNISRKNWVIKLICGLQINIRVSYKLLLSLLVDVARHTQSNQNKTFAKSLKYFKKEVRDKHDFLQTGSIAFAGKSQAYPKYPKWKVYNIFAISSKKKEGMKLIFCMQININFCTS